MSEPRLTWSVEEYPHKEKGADWYWALGIIAVIGAALSVVYGNILFAVIIVLGGAMLGYYALRRPQVIRISISDEGIAIDDYLYPFDTLKGFNVEEHQLGSYLLIESSRSLIPVTSIPLPAEGLDFQALRELLRTRIEEKEHITEPTSHRIMEHLGF